MPSWVWHLRRESKYVLAKPIWSLRSRRYFSEYRVLTWDVLKEEAGLSIGASSVAVEAKDILLPGISFVESDKLTSAAVGEEMPEGVLLN